jgi:hypothetical protein
MVFFMIAASSPTPIPLAASRHKRMTYTSCCCIRRRAVSLFKRLFSWFCGQTAGDGLLVSRGFVITQNDEPQSAVLPWTSDQILAETSN